MRVISVAKLEPGQIVGRPVIDDQGQILLNKGVRLTPEYIEAVTSKGFSHIYIVDTDAGVNIEGDEDLNPATRAEAIQCLNKAFDAIQNQVAKLREQSFDTLSRVCSSDVMRALMSKGGPFESIGAVVGNILKEVLTRSTLAGLTSIKSVDARLYNHSVDVCVLSVMLGRAVGLSDQRLRQLAMGALLHDIGKIFVDRTASEISQIRQHTLLGFELLKNSPDPDLLAPHVALEHHERQDGSGEPRGLCGSNRIERDRMTATTPVPTLIGEIAAVANVYDNLVTGTANRPPLTPDMAIQAIRAASGNHLNQAIVTAFIRLVPVFPLGAEVIVRSTGEYRNFSGIVGSINPSRLDRPTVMLCRDNKGEKISPIELDLSTEECKDMRIRCKVS